MARFIARILAVGSRAAAWNIIRVNSYLKARTTRNNKQNSRLKKEKAPMKNMLHICTLHGHIHCNPLISSVR